MTARNPCLDAPSPRDQFDRLILIDPTEIPKTTPPEREARAVIEAERIKVTGGPWPERIGCAGSIVADPGDGVYPFSRRKASA